VDQSEALLIDPPISIDIEGNELPAKQARASKTSVKRQQPLRMPLKEVDDKLRYYVNHILYHYPGINMMMLRTLIIGAQYQFHFNRIVNDMLRRNEIEVYATKTKNLLDRQKDREQVLYHLFTVHDTKTDRTKFLTLKEVFGHDPLKL